MISPTFPVPWSHAECQCTCQQMDFWAKRRYISFPESSLLEMCYRLQENCVEGGETRSFRASF